jgi:hypothetical protein
MREANERAAREETLLKRYEAQETECFAAAAATKRLNAAKAQATVQQVLTACL